MSQRTRITEDIIRAGTQGMITPSIAGYVDSDILRMNNSINIENTTGDTVIALRSSNDNNTSIQFVNNTVTQSTIQYNNTLDQLEMDNIAINEDTLYPLVDNAYSLGQPEKRWSTIHTSGILMNGDLDMNGNAITNWGSLSSGILHCDTDGRISSSPIVNNDIEDGTISNVKLATSITSSNNGSSIVSRDADGNFSAGVITCEDGLTIGSSSLTSAASFLSELTNANALASKLTPGTGISISGSTISSTGVISVTGTNNQITHSSTTGDITLSLPQNIHTGATPTFAGLTIGSSSLTSAASFLSELTNANALASKLTPGTGISISGSTVSSTGVTSVTGTNNQITHSSTTGDITLTLPQNIHTGATPTFAGLTIGSSSLTSAASFLSELTNANALASKLTPGTGISISGNTISSTGVVSITGTNNQIIHTSTTGTITLSLPQDIHSGASPAFTGLTLSGLSSNGIVHSGLNGALSTSLIVNNDITDGTISHAKLANISSANTPSCLVVRDSDGNLSAGRGTFDDGVSFGTDDQMLQTHDGDNGHIIVDTGLLHIRPTDNSALGTVLNPASYNSVIQMEDGLGTIISNPALRGGELQGSATMESGYVRLVPGSVSTFGQLIYRGHPGNSFTVEYDARIEDVTKAYGVWFFFNQSAVPSNMAMSTTGLGGYALAIDVYNSASTTADKLSLYWNGTLLTSTELSTSHSNLALVSNRWIRVKIIFCMNQFWVTLNEVAVPGFYPCTDTRRPLSLTNDYYGFAAYSGLTFTPQDVTNIRICKSNGGPITPMNDIAVIGTNGKMAVHDLSAVERFSVTDDGVTTVTGSMMIKDTDSSALGTVLNPASYNSVIQMEDGLATLNSNPVLRAGTLTGDATMQSGYVRLVPGTASTYGSLVYRGHPGNSFTVEFEARIGDVTKADGLWFFFNQNGSESGGYRLLIDVLNSSSTSADRLALRWDGVDVTSTLLPTNNANLALVSDTWIRFKIIFCINQFWVTLNEWAVPGFYPYTDIRRPLSLNNDYYGFTGFSGGIFTSQDVRNIRICKSNGGPITLGHTHIPLSNSTELSIANSSRNYVFKVSEDGVKSLYYKSGAIRLAGSSDTNHEISFDSGVDGPKIKGNTGGILATGTKELLKWNNNGVQTQSILPIDTNTHNLGTLDKTWNDIYCNGLFMNGIRKARPCGATLWTNIPPNTSSNDIPTLSGSNYRTGTDNWEPTYWDKYTNSRIFGGCSIESGRSIKVPVAGFYIISCSASFRTGDSDREVAISVRRGNDTGNDVAGSRIQVSTNTWWSCPSFRVIDEANANDTYTIYVWYSSGNAFNYRNMNFTVHSL